MRNTALGVETVVTSNQQGAGGRHSVQPGTALSPTLRHSEERRISTIWNLCYLHWDSPRLLIAVDHSSQADSGFWFPDPPLFNCGWPRCASVSSSGMQCIIGPCVRGLETEFSISCAVLSS